jgi:hypothetical protein
MLALQQIETVGPNSAANSLLTTKNPAAHRPIRFAKPIKSGRFLDQGAFSPRPKKFFPAVREGEAHV